MTRRTGQCLCGAVRFETAGEVRPITYCHCSQCRRQTGHFYAATSVADEALTVAGEDRLTWYAASPDAKRGFCRTCGSALFWKRNGGSSISIMAGGFDEPSRLIASHHIFAADKGSYYAIDDGLPIFPQSAG